MDLIKLPKIELHCHLDGSVRPGTVISIAKKEGITIPSYDSEVIKNMMIAPMECTSLREYLKRFTLPNAVMQSKEGLRRIAYELIEDAAKENVKYIEIRFAPLLHIEKGLTIEEVIKTVLDGIKDGENTYGIKSNLILSCLRHMPEDTVYDVIEAGKKFLGKGVVAIDLCGNEEEGFSKKFIESIKAAREYGYRVTIHAGETGIGKNVLEAVEVLKAERIGHGVFIKDCPEAYSVVKNKEITLEMCPTSNVQTKAVSSYGDHPIINFYKDGVKVTVNTDNRTVSNTDLSNEYKFIFNEFNLTLEDYKELYNNSINASFAPEEVKEQLRAYFE
ncbi:adenosine deaminase [uncultured Clostridium sp.]|uniref:adenosine deaminase n=1 Tax=uncultured Clostridium sp. TaxID=59620 RepID=UPI0028E4054E|nr:adenosine deaminase [uncultured Clostridium sp.]